jgi:hypothetical protein
MVLVDRALVREVRRLRVETRRLALLGRLRRGKPSRVAGRLPARGNRRDVARQTVGLEALPADVAGDRDADNG